MSIDTDFEGDDSTDVNGGEEALDAIELLSNDHEKVRQLFEEYEQLEADEASDGDRQALAEQICDALTAHMTAEEEIFYPAASTALRDTEMTDDAKEEHASAQALITRLLALEPRDALYGDTMRLLREAIEHHVAEEEGELFPQLRESSLDLPALAEEITRRKEELEAQLLDERS